MKRLIATTIFIISANVAFTQVRLPRLVRDSMVLQRDTRIHIWGWSSPGEKISISFSTFGKKSAAVKANEKGEWHYYMPVQKAGGPYQMKIKGTNEITLSNIMIGDVWICAGQSNMVLPMERVKEKYPEEVAQANNPDIRHFFIPTLTDLQKPHDDLPAGNWKAAVGKDILQFSATAYFFAKNIYERYHVPIGLINASVGGTPIEAWISEEGLQKFPSVVSALQKNKDTVYVNTTNRTAAAANANRPPVVDKGLIADKKWFDPTYEPKGWRTMHIPGYWEDQGIKDLDGVVWFRREIDVPASMTGVAAKLFMGRIVDADFVYVNGKLVGNITYQYPPRRYDVPADLLKPGKNLIVIRVINSFGKGGFVPDKNYSLIANGQTIDLKGDWQYKVGDVFVPQGPAPNGISFQNQPAALYNAMVAPLINYSVKGFLWYQGETNAGRPAEYADYLPALINDWRSKWNQPNAPFLFAQLPNFMDIQYLPSQSNWAMMRESQAKALSIPNTGMAITIDLGEWNDIHPLNKKAVGERLALAARKVAYNEKDLVHSGPLFRSATIEGNKIIVYFDNIGSGLIAKDGEELSQFAIAGEDKKFVWASAKIEGDKVIVWNEKIQQPKYVRYAWADNPVDANLFNKEGLPASPFRTDR